MEELQLAVWANKIHKRERGKQGGHHYPVVPTPQYEI